LTESKTHTHNQSVHVRLFVVLAGAVILTGLLWPSVAVGEVRRICKVSYQTRFGWSEEVTAEITFVTGQELNKSTRTFDYNPYSNYALIWFEPGRVAILQHDGTVFGVGPEFDNEDFVKMFQFVSTSDFSQLNDDPSASRKWRVKAKDFIKFIDPRVER